jgi:hypothetical protein
LNADQEFHSALCWDPQAVHPGIHLDMYRGPSSPPKSSVTHKRQLALVVNHWGGSEGESRPRFFHILDAAENEDRESNCGIPQLRGLAHPCDRKVFTACRGETAHDGHGSVPVGIGLDHGNYSALPRKTPCQGKVRGQGGEIDAGDCRLRKFHPQFYNPSKIGPKSSWGV